MSRRNKAIARQKYEEKRQAENENLEATVCRSEEQGPSVSDSGVSPSGIEIEITTPEDTSSSRGLGIYDQVLCDPNRLHEDLEILQQAVNEEWDIPKERRRVVVDRLYDIVGKTSVAVPTKDGLMQLDGPADKNSISASKVLLGMVGQNQAAKQKPVTNNVFTGQIHVLVVRDNGRGPDPADYA